MAKMILGVFADKLEAEHAVDELVGGALSGTTTGGVIGGLTGLLIGIGAILIGGSQGRYDPTSRYGW